MANSSNSSGAASSPSSAWPTTSRQQSRRGGRGKPSSPRRPTREKSATTKKSGRPFGAKSRNRKDELLRRLKIDPASLLPEIGPQIRLCGVTPQRMIDVLRCDLEPLSAAAVANWDRLTPAERSLLGLEGVAALSGMSPRRLWEIYSGAALMQAKEAVGIMLAEAIPQVMRVTIKEAKKAKGIASREHILKAARVLPTPKGSVTTINLPGTQQLGDGGEDAPDQGAELEGADGFLLRASRAMGSMSLPAPKAETIDAEMEDEEEGSDGLG